MGQKEAISSWKNIGGDGMKLRSFSWIVFVGGLVLALLGAAVPAFVMMWAETGIIGGAGWPTYEYCMFRVLEGFPFCMILLGGTLAVWGLFCLLFPNAVAQNCTKATSAVALGLSAFGGLGLSCFFTWYTIVSFGNMARYPVAYPCSIAAGIVALAAFLALLWVYIKLRKQSLSWRGIVIDMFTAFIFVLPFFYGVSCLAAML